MDIKDALGEIRVSRLKSLAREAPMLGGADVVAACIYEAQELPGGPDRYAARVVSALEDGGLLLISWTADYDYTVSRIPSRNIASASFQGSARGTPLGTAFYWSEPTLVVDLFHPVNDEQRLEFHALPRERGNLGSQMYDDDVQPADALKAVAEALFARLD